LELQMTEISNDRANPSQTLKGRSYADTRSAVLDLIRSSGAISRVDLARRSALAEATISKIVKELIGTGVVEQFGFAESTGGKRPALLRLSDVGVYALGVTLDFHRSFVVLCGADGSELARREAPGTGRDDPSVALDRLAAGIEDLVTQQRIDRSRIIGLGVATSGRRGSPLGWVVDASFFDAWEPYPIESELATRTGFPVLQENDANCAALREFWTSQEPARDFITMYMSNGIGAGIVINGAIYRGSSGNAGEIGHTMADPEGLPCWCGAVGCLETVASPRAIVNAALADSAVRTAWSIVDTTPPTDVYRNFVESAAKGEKWAGQMLARAARHFAIEVSNLVNTLDLSLVVLAGAGFDGVADVFLEAVRARIEETAFMREVHPITVRLASVGSETAALGAASVVLHRHLTPHRSTIIM
jgi:predicted NBD/HSP70 family sugar kinase